MEELSNFVGHLSSTKVTPLIFLLAFIPRPLIMYRLGKQTCHRHTGGDAGENFALRRDKFELRRDKVTVNNLSDRISTRVSLPKPKTLSRR